MRRFRNIFGILMFAFIMSGIILEVINHGNIISHTGMRRYGDILDSQEVLDIVSIYLGISESEVSELEIELNQDKNLYEICFNVNDQSYYFEVHSMTGTILNSNN